MTPSFSHTSVMLNEITDLMSQAKGTTLDQRVFADLTLGGAGHATELLRSNPDAIVHGFDRDPVACTIARERGEPFDGRLIVHQAEFSEAPQVLEAGLAGFLLDLGVSSPQLDVAERGFSYRNDGPLDMRMDQTHGLTAADVVNEYPPGELIDVLAVYGDERHAKRIVSAIIENRPFTRTVELANVVTSAIPAAARRTGGHPATRTFQALRIEVNAELAMLGPTLEAMIELLAVGGLGVVLTYHSGEDRITKDRMRQAVEGDDLPGLPTRSDYAWAFRGARQPSESEIETNPRARSARLRAIRRESNAASGVVR